MFKNSKFNQTFEENFLESEEFKEIIDQQIEELKDL